MVRFSFVLLLILTSIAGLARADLTDTVPNELAVAVVGEWDLGPKGMYHISLSRHGSGLSVDEDAAVRPSQRDTRHENVRYDPNSNLLGFWGIGRMHRAFVFLRWTGSELEYAMSSEIRPGKWIHGLWEKAVPGGPRGDQ